MDWLLDRMKEKSTWVALSGLLVAVFGFTTEQGEAVIMFGTAIATLGGVAAREIQPFTGEIPDPKNPKGGRGG